MKTAYFKTKNGFEYQYLPRYKGIVYNDISRKKAVYLQVLFWVKMIKKWKLQ